MRFRRRCRFPTPRRKVQAVWDERNGALQYFGVALGLGAGGIPQFERGEAGLRRRRSSQFCHRCDSKCKTLGNQTDFNPVPSFCTLFSHCPKNDCMTSSGHGRIGEESENRFERFEFVFKLTTMSHLV